MTPINFKANFLKNISIQKLIDSDKYEPIEAAVVELDFNDAEDINVLEKITEKWEKVAHGYAEDINAYAINSGYGYMYDAKNNHCYALTTQLDNHKILDYNKVQGLALFVEKYGKFNSLELLQVNPDTNKEQFSRMRPYKNVGSALVSYIKDISKKTISVFSSKNAIPFYIKQGFQKIVLNNERYLIYEL